jgi:hypothetical protein
MARQKEGKKDAGNEEERHCMKTKKGGNKERKMK